MEIKKNRTILIVIIILIIYTAVLIGFMIYDSVKLNQPLCSVPLLVLVIIPQVNI